MLGNQSFYWEHFKKYIILMGTILNDITIVRESGGKRKEIKIPISFSQRDRQLERLRSNPELRQQWRAILPRIGFEMGSPIYAPDRKDNTYTKYAINGDGLKQQMQMPAAPYDIPFTATLWSPYYEDGLQVTEQILPFFQPEYYVKVDEVAPLNLQRDVSIALVGVTQNDQFEGDYEESRIIEWSFEFMLKGFFYGPIKEQRIIKKALVDFMFDLDAENSVQYSATVVPFEAQKTDPHTIVEVTEEP